LRDIEGWIAEEVCELLEISEGNQRVLLHRARLRVRAVLSEYVSIPAAVEPFRAEGEWPPRGGERPRAEGRTNRARKPHYSVA